MLLKRLVSYPRPFQGVMTPSPNSRQSNFFCFGDGGSDGGGGDDDGGDDGDGGGGGGDDDPTLNS